MHGFPDSAYLWEGVIEKLSDIPNQIIIPDCLGYAGTDKPAVTTLYAYKGQTDDLVDMLTRENVESCVIIGHDWGSALAQRTFLYHRQLFGAVILLNAGYTVPSANRFDLAAANDATERLLGYPQFFLLGVLYLTRCFSNNRRKTA